MSVLQIPLCIPHLRDMEELGGSEIPDYVWVGVGLEACGTLRARFPRRYGGGGALGVQCVLPEFCVWCQGPEPFDDSFFDMEERLGEAP